MNPTPEDIKDMAEQSLFWNGKQFISHPPKYGVFTSGFLINKRFSSKKICRKWADWNYLKKGDGRYSEFKIVKLLWDNDAQLYLQEK